MSKFSLKVLSIKGGNEKFLRYGDKKAAEILSAARRPLMYGWSSTVCEATKEGIELAEEMGAVIYWSANPAAAHANMHVGNGVSIYR